MNKREDNQEPPSSTKPVIHLSLNMTPEMLARVNAKNNSMLDLKGLKKRLHISMAEKINIMRGNLKDFLRKDKESLNSLNGILKDQKPLDQTWEA